MYLTCGYAISVIEKPSFPLLRFLPLDRVLLVWILAECACSSANSVLVPPWG